MSKPEDLFSSLLKTTEDLLGDNMLRKGVEVASSLLTAVLPAIGASPAFRFLEADQSVAKWSQQRASQLKETLADKNDSGMLTLVREHHFAVTYKGGDLLSMLAKTVDGSDKAGSHGDNIGQLEMTVLLRWSSLVREDGFTEIQITVYPASQSPSRATMIRTNAMFTKSKLTEMGTALVRLIFQI